jgi:lipopolysaccharide transport system ATP-binding protein
MKPIIKVENLSKAYQIGQIGTGTLSRDVDRFWQTKILGKEDPFLKIGETNDRSTKGESNIVWSLKDINFDINQGEAVGIIGKNGAGKSTLLKLLSRVTSPTTGSIKVKGRIASLLEVGTGFHPELSGRENIYLNGAILGMRKKEITRKLDEIINFSGVERYIDTPVKRYSSGMYVRLAFAVAAHLESEILIVDEVLAVGDAEFQKKCLGKMGDISKGEGRTVLFVSHNMGSIKELCTRSILLENGKLIHNGNTKNIIDKYLMKTDSGISIWENKRETNPEDFYFTRVEILNKKMASSNNIATNEKFFIKIKGHSLRDIPNATISIRFTNSEGVPIFTTALSDLSDSKVISKGDHDYLLEFDNINLIPGQYSLLIACFISRQKLFDSIENDLVINIENLSGFDLDPDRRGMFIPMLKWT